MNRSIEVILIMTNIIADPVALACDCKLPHIKKSVEQLSKHNMVQEPTYTFRLKKKKKVVQEVPPPEKLQYEADTSEMPLLVEEKAPHEQAQGIEYNEGTDTFVTPRSKEVIKDEVIVEPNEEAEKAIPNSPPSTN